MKAKIGDDGRPVKAPKPELAGYGFCTLCGGLFRLTAAGELPSHGWVGHGSAVCPGTEFSQEGEISP